MGTWRRRLLLFPVAILQLFDYHSDTVICNFKIFLWLMGHRANLSSHLATGLFLKQKKYRKRCPGSHLLGWDPREMSRALEYLLSGVIWVLWCSWIRIRTLWPQLGIMGVSEP